MEHKMIQPLSDDARAQLRTGVTLTTFSQVVEELVLNSIDAGATSVAVRVDLPWFKIQVVDNGTGITRNQLELIGERYSTSKCHTVEDLENLKYFGYRGEALASLKSASSFLEIISRPRSASITLSKCFQNGKAYGVTESPVPRPSAGSTITAHGVFYNLPVRRKGLNEGLEMERIRYRLAGIALMWPKISISLRDDSIGHVILQTRKCSGMVASFSHIFTPARAKGLMDVGIEGDEFKLSGIVSKESYSRKDLQFVFVNKRLVLKSSIHRQINKILGRSHILKRKGLNLDVSEKLLNSEDKNANNSGSPTKQTERYGIFAINVECPYSAYDITFDPAKTLVEFRDWPKLIHLLQDMLYGHLRKENLLSSVPVSVPNTNDDVEDDEKIISDNFSEEDNHEGVDNEISKTAVQQHEKGISAISTQNTLFSKQEQRQMNRGVDKSLDNEKTQAVSNAECQPASSLTSPVIEISERGLVPINRPTNLVEMDKKKNLHHKRACSDVSTKTQINENYDRNGEVDRVKRPLLLQDEVGSSKTLDTQLLLMNYSKTVRPVQSQDEQELPVHVSKCDPAESEEVLVSGKLVQKIKRKEITLGNVGLVHYSSTLQSLRDSNPTVIPGTLKVSEIITSTLQQLKKSVKNYSKNVGDPYKTPERFIKRRHGYEEDPPESKIQKQQTQADVTKELKTSRSLSSRLGTANDSQTCSPLHIDAPSAMTLKPNKKHGANNSSGLSTIYLSETENRCLGQKDRVIPLKRSSQQKLSHASKLGKLMRGETMTDSHTVSNSDNQDDDFGSDESRHVDLIKSFKYNRKLQQRTELPVNCFVQKHSNPLEISAEVSPVRKQRHSMDTVVESGDTPVKNVIPQAILNVSELAQGKISKQDSVPSGASNYDHITLSDNKDSPHGTSSHCVCRPCKEQRSRSRESHPLTLGADCSVCCCCQLVSKTSTESSTRQVDLPFSVYKQSRNDLHDSSNNCPKSPKVSVILSMPMEPVKITENKSTTRPVLFSNHRLDPPESVTSHCLTISQSHNLTSKMGGKASCFQPQGIQNSSGTKFPGNAETQSESDCPLIGKVSESFEFDQETLSLPLSQGFSPHLQDTETSSDSLLSSPMSHEIGPDRKTGQMKAKVIPDAPLGYNSTGFSPSVTAAFERNEDSSSPIHLTEGSNQEAPNAVTGVGPENLPCYLLSDTDCDVTMKRLTESETQSSSCNTEYDVETHSVSLLEPSHFYSTKESDTILHDETVTKCKQSDTILHDETVTKCKPLHTCSNSQSSYFDQITGSNSRQSPVCKSKKDCPQPGKFTDTFLDTGNTQDNGPTNNQHSVLAFDSLNNSGDCNTVPETGGFDQDKFSVTTEHQKNIGNDIQVQTKDTYESRIAKSSMKTIVRFDRESSEEGNAIVSHSEANATQASKEIGEKELCQSNISSKESVAVVHSHKESTELRQMASDISLEENSLDNFLSHQTIPCAQEIKSSIPDAMSNDNDTNFFPFLSTTSQVTMIKQGSYNGVNQQGSESLFEDLNFVPSTISHEANNNNNNNTPTSFGSTSIPDWNIRLSQSFDQAKEISNMSEQDPDVEDTKPTQHTPDSMEKTDMDKQKSTVIFEGKQKISDVQSDAVKCSSPSVCLIGHGEIDQLSQDPQNEQKESKSSAKDNLLLMVDALEDWDNMSSSYSNNRLTHSDTHFYGNDTELEHKLPDEFKRNSNQVTPKNCESETSLLLQPRVSITVSGAFSTNTDPSPLSLLRQPRVFEGGEEVLAKHNQVGKYNSKDIQPNTSTCMTITAGETKQVPAITCLNAKLIRESGPEKVTHPVRTMDKEVSESNAPVSCNLNVEAEITSDCLHLPGLKVMKNVSLPVENGNAGSVPGSVDVSVERPVACWKEVTDSETGLKMYINNLSGHTVSKMQWSEMSTQAQMDMLDLNPTAAENIKLDQEPIPLSVDGRQLLQDMVMKHVEVVDTESLSKWRKGKKPVYDQEVGADISSLMTKWKNPVFLNYKEPTVTTDKCPGGTVARSCFNSLSLVEFTKDMLKDVKVIGQLDNKFIACMIEKPQDRHITMMTNNKALLVLFDQHAVHERVRLEYFTEDSYEVENDVRTDRIRRSEVSPPQPLKMDQDDVRIMKAFSKEFDRIGILFHADKTCRRTVHIRSVPSCIAQKDSYDLKKFKNVVRTERNIENLIKEHIGLLKSTNGACGRMPLTIHKVLCSQACHGAVKFGDELTLQECQNLISSLSSCNLPFQCAHGRPSVAPLVDLTALERELHVAPRKPNLWNISQHLNN